MNKKKFPGFRKCMSLMRKSDSQSQEDGFHWLLPKANEFVEDIIIEFNEEKDHGLKCWLLELIGESKSDLSFPILKKYLDDEDEALNSWAVHGLKNLDSKEARKLLINKTGANNG